jgi:hypothetical protein
MNARMRTQIVIRLPLPGAARDDAPTFPAPLFACALAPPDLLETASAMVLAGVVVLHAAFVVTMLVVVLAA